MKIGKINNQNTLADKVLETDSSNEVVGSRSISTSTSGVSGDLVTRSVVDELATEQNWERNATSGFISPINANDQLLMGNGGIEVVGTVPSLKLTGDDVYNSGLIQWRTNTTQKEAFIQYYVSDKAFIIATKRTDSRISLRTGINDLEVERFGIDYEGVTTFTVAEDKLLLTSTPTGDVSGAIATVGYITEVQSEIGVDITSLSGAIDTNTSNIALNDIDITSLSGVIDTNTSNIASNDIDITYLSGEIDTNTSAISANTTHSTSDGTDHTFIDQDVTSSGSPTFVEVEASVIDCDQFTTSGLFLTNVGFDADNIWGSLGTTRTEQADTIKDANSEDMFIMAQKNNGGTGGIGFGYQGGNIYLKPGSSTDPFLHGSVIIEDPTDTSPIVTFHPVGVLLPDDSSILFAGDTNLYRDSANVLKTDDDFQAGSLQSDSLDTYDNSITISDLSGNISESSVTIDDSIAGGSILNLAEFGVAPETSGLVTGATYILNSPATSGKILRYYDGTDLYGIELSKV